nr:PREDICTED: guanylate-binding protein 4-like [Rhinolophus sinicus]
MWCVPHPSKQNHTLVLLDTEGLGDVEKGDSNNDSWIFALAVLLSNMFVYNSMGTINHQALEQLHYVTKLTNLIRTKSSPRSGDVDDSAEFVSFSPDFVWTVRDFMLDLELDGQPITEDEYLENALKLIPGEGSQIQNSNRTRECIRKFFPKQKCFVFDRPTNDKKVLRLLHEASETQLETTFQEQSKNFCSYVFKNAEPKTLRQGIIVNGNRLGTLVVTYVDAINSGAVPCLENAVTTLVQLENSAAVQKAAAHYSEQMAQRVRFPTDTLQELLVLHAACEREATEIFMEHSFKDENQEFQKKLVKTIQEKKGNFLLQNEEASDKYCRAQLLKLLEPLRNDISRSTFSVPGGYNLYLEARHKVEQSYKLVPRKGVKGNEVLQSILQSLAATEESILQTAERAKNQALQKEQEIQRQKLKEMQEKMEAQEKTFQENMVQLKKKMQEETEIQLREQEKMLEHKWKMQKELLEEGFKKKSAEMEKEINQLKEKYERVKNNSAQIPRILSLASSVLLSVLPGVPKILSIGMKLLRF